MSVAPAEQLLVPDGLEFGFAKLARHTVAPEDRSRFGHTVAVPEALLTEFRRAAKHRGLTEFRPRAKRRPVESFPWDRKVDQ